jgi:hypothetical protein
MSIPGHSISTVTQDEHFVDRYDISISQTLSTRKIHMISILMHQMQISITDISSVSTGQKIWKSEIL